MCLLWNRSRCRILQISQFTRRDTPFQGDFPILERVSINEATLTAFIDANDIVTTFGTDFNCLQITARIDKIQLGAPVTKAYKNSAYSSGYS